MKHLIYQIGIYALTDQVVANMVVSKASFQAVADPRLGIALVRLQPLCRQARQHGQHQREGLNQGIFW